MSNIVRFQDSGISLDARVEAGQVWLTYEQTAELFGVDINTIKEHAQCILADQELPESTRRNFRLVRTEGNRSVNRDILHLNQEMVAHIGYRVRSDKGIEFRKWATAQLMGGGAPQLPAADIDPMTALQLAQTAALQFLAKQHEETRMIANDAFKRVTSLEAYRADAEAKLTAAAELPSPSVDVSPRTDGQRTVALLSAWAAAHFDAYKQAWDLLYRAVEECPETRIDLKSRLKNANAKKPRGAKAKRVCDIIDESGKAAEIYSIAFALFRDKQAS